MASILPSLPIEIAEHIISALWLSSLEARDRTLLVKSFSSSEMSGLLHDIFLRVASTDVYLLGFNQASVLLDMLRGNEDEEYPVEQEYYDILMNSLASGLCRSITIEHDAGLLDRATPVGIGFVFRDIIDEIKLSMPLQFPCLRRISLELNTGDHPIESVMESYWSLFSCVPPFSDFPQQVTQLEVVFTYGERKKPCCRFEKSESASGFQKKLTVLGTSERVAKQLLGVLTTRTKGEPMFEHSHAIDTWKEENDDDDPAEEWFDAETGLTPPLPHPYPWVAHNFIAYDSVLEEAVESLLQSCPRDELVSILSEMERRRTHYDA
ncbi:hypothetical protein V5O48_001146 [Marasmius crinis-equi]|uniref:Uncharacterized protein n=1 Tax=Marasmius crinis-equi TaxID=585013 RepID=A0ABR3FZC3_9AGAR